MKAAAIEKAMRAWQAAFLAANNASVAPQIEYTHGWFRIAGGCKFRLKKLEEMTETLKRRAGQ